MKTKETPIQLCVVQWIEGFPLTYARRRDILPYFLRGILFKILRNRHTTTHSMLPHSFREVHSGYVQCNMTVLFWHWSHGHDCTVSGVLLLVERVKVRVHLDHACWLATTILLRGDTSLQLWVSEEFPFPPLVPILCLTLWHCTLATGCSCPLNSESRWEYEPLQIACSSCFQTSSLTLMKTEWDWLRP